MENLKELKVTLNTMQGLEIINVINKLGLKEKLKEFLLGTGESGKMKHALAVKEQQYQQLVLDLIEEKMIREEFEKLNESEKNDLLKDVLTEDAIKIGSELNKMQNEINVVVQNEAFDLFYTAIIERLYSNKDVIFKALASIYNVKVKQLEKQNFSETALMIKKIIESESLKDVLDVFL